MNQSLKYRLGEVSKRSTLVASKITELIKEKLTQPSVDFFHTEPGMELIKRIQKKLLQKATAFDDGDTSLNLDFSTTEEVEGVMGHKDEIISFLKDEVGIEISHWYQNMAPMLNSTFITMKCAA